MYEIIILPFVIYGCDTVCVTLKKECGLAVVGYRKIDKLHNDSDVWLTVHRNSVWIRKTN